MQLLPQGEGGRGWGSPNSALWGDHACWKVELAIVMILSTELQLSRNIIIMTNIIFIIIRLPRNIIFMIASRHSLTLAYTNTTIIATTSFPVTWPLFAVRSTMMMMMMMMMTGYLMMMMMMMAGYLAAFCGMMMTTKAAICRVISEQ